MPDSCHAGRKSPSSFHDPVPLRRELLDKSTRERALAVPTLPDVHRASSEFRGAVFSVFEKLETTLLGTIEPEDDSLAQFGRLVVVSKLYPPLKIVEVRRYHPLDCSPRTFRRFDIPAGMRARVQVVQIEHDQSVTDILRDFGKRHRRKQRVGRSPSIRKEVLVRRWQCAKDRSPFVRREDVQAIGSSSARSRFRAQPA